MSTSILRHAVAALKLGAPAVTELLKTSRSGSASAARRLRDRGIQESRAGNHEEAARCFIRAVETSPTDVKLRRSAAKELRAVGKPMLAALQLGAALTLAQEPALRAVLLDEAAGVAFDCWESAGDTARLEEAISLLELARSEAPKDLLVAWNLTDAYLLAARKVRGKKGHFRKKAEAAARITVAIAFDDRAEAGHYISRIIADIEAHERAGDFAYQPRFWNELQRDLHRAATLAEAPGAHLPSPRRRRAPAWLQLVAALVIGVSALFGVVHAVASVLQGAAQGTEQVVPENDSSRALDGVESLARVERDHLARVERDHLARVERDHLARVERDHLARVERDHLARVERDHDRGTHPSFA